MTTDVRPYALHVTDEALADLRDLVRREFHGTSTCTHLNDELRSLGDAHALVALLHLPPG